MSPYVPLLRSIVPLGPPLPGPRIVSATYDERERAMGAMGHATEEFTAFKIVCMQSIGYEIGALLRSMRSLSAR
jgi:hypothetical protein